MNMGDFEQSSSSQTSATGQDWLQSYLDKACERAEKLRKDAKAAAQEETVLKTLNEAVQKEWWCHVLAIIEREKEFFHRLRIESHSAVPRLEELFHCAKREVDDAFFSMPRDMEKLSERLKLPLDMVQSRHPKYFFRDGFITVEVIEKKRIARLYTYEGKLAELPADIKAIEEALGREDKRLFGRKFDGKKFLKKMRRAYLAILKKENRKDGEEVPLRQIMTEMAKGKSSHRRDEFVLDLSRLTEQGPASVDGMRFQLQQTKDSQQGVLLYGPSARGMVNLLIFKKEKP